MKRTPKSAVIKALSKLDNRQAESVLHFVESLTETPQQDRDYAKFRRDALREIRSALRERSL